MNSIDGEGPLGRRRAQRWPAMVAVAMMALSACGDDGAEPEPDPGVEPTDRDARAPAGERDGGMDAAARPSPMDASAMLDALAPAPSDGAVVTDAQVSSDAAPQPALFAEDKLLEVSITLSPGDWDALRQEGRNLSDVFSGCQPEDFDYTKFHASVTIAGQTLADVGVRKKGFLGSLSVRKPSLRLELDEYVDGQRVLGAKTFVLNNNLTDPSYTHTCMAYAAYRRAGIPAPRCSFARVTVNGELLGVYNHVEPVNKPFLKRAFGNDEGNLYEGAAPADFRTDLLQYFEKKTHKDDAGKPELEALALLLTKSDDELLAGLDALVDLEHFYRYWATETLIANWDGYSSNNNNFFVYADAVSKKLKFIPWGPDDAFDRNPILLSRKDAPQAVYATARLSRRLYAIDSTRERYRQALRDQLSMHWRESDLLAEVDRIGALVGVAAAAQLDKQRDFIRTRRAQLEAELAVAALPWPFAEPLPGACVPERVVPITGTFRTTWESLPAPTPALDNSLSIIGRPQLGVAAVAGSGVVPEPQTLANSRVALTIVRPDGSLLVVQYQLGQQPLRVGTLPLHGFETFAAVLTGPDAASLKLVGLVGEGTITLTEASSTTGKPVVGSFSGKMAAVAPLPLYPPLPAAPLP